MIDEADVEALARLIYEGMPASRNIDEENFDPVPWDELKSGPRFAWKARARHVLRAGWQRPDDAQNAVRVARVAVENK